MRAFPRIFLLIILAFALQGCRGQSATVAQDPGPPPPSLVKRPWGLSEALLAALANGRTAEVEALTEHLPAELSSEQAVRNLADQSKGRQALREEISGSRAFVYVGADGAESLKLSFENRAGVWRLVGWQALAPK